MMQHRMESAVSSPAPVDTRKGGSKVSLNSPEALTHQLVHLLAKSKNDM